MDLLFSEQNDEKHESKAKAILDKNNKLFMKVYKFDNTVKNMYTFSMIFFVYYYFIPIALFIIYYFFLYFIFYILIYFIQEIIFYFLLLLIVFKENAVASITSFKSNTDDKILTVEVKDINLNMDVTITFIKEYDIFIDHSKNMKNNNIRILRSGCIGLNDFFIVSAK